MKFRAPRAIRRLRIGLAVVATAALGSLGLAAAQAAPASAATACSVTYSVSSQWSTGFSVSITITNTGDPLTSWSLGYSYAGNQQLAQGWSGNWTQSGSSVTVTNASWNGSLATNASTQIGANFNYSGTNTAPTAFTLNGTTCNGGGGGGGGGTGTGSIVASSSSLSVAQGSSATFGLSLSSAPSSNVTVSVARASGNTGLSVSSGGSLTFTPSNYATAQNVTIAADTSSTGAATFTASATGYPTVSVTVTETSASGGGGGTTVTHVADPFTGAKPYLNPDYVSEVKAQATSDGSAAEASVANYQTAIWLDTIAAINGGGSTGRTGLQQQLTNAAAEGTSSTPALAEIVIYDLPGRDCAALASNGEIPATAAGLTEYESQYIDPIASILSQFENDNLRIVAIIEPDSLPNVVTNQSMSACQTATPYYEQGIEYALNKLHAIPNVYNYMDIAHSAWLGWPSNMSATPAVYNTVVKATTAGYDSIDGFISDTANYTPVQEPLLTNPTLSVGGQPVDSATFYQYNPTFDEYTYDTQMYNTLVSAGFPSSKRFLIDTSRDGWGPTHPTTITQASDVNTYVNDNKIDQRPFRGDWCNQNNAGIGARPTDEPFGTSSPIEAYVWIKPPGESDGDYPTSTHSHGDPHCDPNGTNTDGNGGTYSTGSIPGYDVPAGQWFAQEFQMLVKNAYPSL
jgi:cellulose 1,4-beta-cellobiosidase